MNMKELKAKTKDFFKKHGKLIAVSTVCVGGIVVLAVMRGKRNKALKQEADKMVKALTEYYDHKDKVITPMVENLTQCWKVGTISDVISLDGETITDLIVNDLKADDLGKLGEELLTVKGIDSEKTISAVLYVFDEVEQKS